MRRITAILPRKKKNKTIAFADAERLTIAGKHGFPVSLTDMMFPKGLSPWSIQIESTDRDPHPGPVCWERGGRQRVTDNSGERGVQMCHLTQLVARLFPQPLSLHTCHKECRVIYVKQNHLSNSLVTSPAIEENPSPFLWKLCDKTLHNVASTLPTNKCPFTYDCSNASWIFFFLNVDQFLPYILEYSDSYV